MTMDPTQTRTETTKKLDYKSSQSMLVVGSTHAAGGGVGGGGGGGGDRRGTAEDAGERMLSEAAYILQQDVMRRVANGLSAFPRNRGLSRRRRGRGGTTAGRSSFTSFSSPWALGGGATRSARQPGSSRGGRGSKAHKTSSPETLLPVHSERSNEDDDRSKSSMDAVPPAIGGEDDQDDDDLLVQEEDGDDVEDELDGSLILSMERTLFSALNMAFTLVMVGVGLMSVGESSDKLPDELGEIIISAAILFTFYSYGVHAYRMRAFRRGYGIGALGSLLWSGSLVFLLVFGLIFELHFAVLYPYLKRSKAVEIANSSSS